MVSVEGPCRFKKLRIGEFWFAHVRLCLIVLLAGQSDSGVSSLRAAFLSGERGNKFEKWALEYMFTFLFKHFKTFVKVAEAGPQSMV